MTEDEKREQIKRKFDARYAELKAEYLRERDRLFIGYHQRVQDLENELFLELRREHPRCLRPEIIKTKWGVLFA